MMDKDRLNHSYAVANKMVDIGKKRGFKENELQDLFILGMVHDIGYRFGDNISHNEIGSEMLKKDGYKYWQEVKYHGVPNCEYKSEYLEILNCADLSVNKYGEDVGFSARIEDIKSRYGEESSQYINCVKMIDELLENPLNKEN